MQTFTTPDLLRAYTGQVRVRVCGLLVHEGALLLAAHRGLLPNDAPFWSPPGGGWEFGESLQDCLVREFREETGLTVVPGRFLHLHEFNSEKLQALELFFAVEAADPAALPRLGSDPEHAYDAQVLTQVAFVPTRDLIAMPLSQVHPVLHYVISPDDVYIPKVQFK